MSMGHVCPRCEELEQAITANDAEMQRMASILQGYQLIVEASSLPPHPDPAEEIARLKEMVLLADKHVHFAEWEVDEMHAYQTSRDAALRGSSPARGEGK